MRLEQYLTEDKWEKKWYKTMMDKKGKKVYSWTYGQYQIIPTGEHPTKGFAFRNTTGQVFWAIIDTSTGRMLKPTHMTLAKAKKFVEQIQ